MKATTARSSVCLLLAVTLVSALAPAAQGSPSAEPTPTPSPSSVDLTQEEAREIDAKQMSLATGESWTPEDIARAESFSVLMGILSTEYADSYSSSTYKDDRTGSPAVHFAEPIPDEARELITASGVKMDVVEASGISEAKRSAIEKEIGELVMRVTREVGCKNPSMLEVRASDGTSNLQTDCVALKPALEKELARGVLKVSSPTIEVGSAPVVTDEVLSGGTRLYKPGRGGLCTSAFTVKNTRENTRGLLTASHCSDDYTYEGRDILTMAGHMDPQTFDAQWYRSNESAWAGFASNIIGTVQQNRFATGTGLATHGMAICKYGQATRLECSTVRSGPRAVITDGIIYTQLWLANKYMTLPGDSGGPWFLGTTANGVHKGSYEWAGGKASIWTAINPIQYQSDLKVITNCTSPC